MRQASLGVVLSILMLLGAGSSALAQEPAATKTPVGYFKAFPLKSVDSQAVMSGVSASTNLPLFNYHVVSTVDGRTYNGMMVGRSPFFHGARTTNIKTILVPIIVKTTDGGVFDPTIADATCAGGKTPISLVQNSPIFLTHDYVFNGVDVGSAQYLDAFQRANFWTNVQPTGSRYQISLSPVTVASAVTFSPPAGHGRMYAAHTFGGQNCAEGVVDIDVLQPFLQNTVIPSLAAQGVGPTTLPFFVLYNVVQAQGGDNIFSNCCVLGFHDAFGSLSSFQTYGIADFELSGVFAGSQNSSTLAHEVGEWMDDPVGSNSAPSWGHIGQVSGCQANVEVGDPLSGTNIPGVLMPNGFTYNLQELAFFSWFFRQTPSLGASGDFSDDGTFAQDAGPVCS